MSSVPSSILLFIFADTDGNREVMQSKLTKVDHITDYCPESGCSIVLTSAYHKLPAVTGGNLLLAMRTPNHGVWVTCLEKLVAMSPVQEAEDISNPGKFLYEHRFVYEVRHQLEEADDALVAFVEASLT